MVTIFIINKTLMKIERIDSLGCVMHPIYTQLTKPNTIEKLHEQTISRMVKYDFFLHNEIAVYQVVSNHTSSFCTFKTAEQITYQKLNTEQHDLTFTKKLEDSDFFLLKYSKRTLYSFKEFCNANNYKNKSHYIRFLINAYIKLLHSIQVLVQNNIVHNQIHYDTICIDENDDVLITQFGLSLYTIVSNINDEYIRPFFAKYEPAYPYWPIEFHVLSYLLANKMETISSLHIEQVIQDIISKNKLFTPLSEMSNHAEKYKKETKIYLSKYINQPLKYIIDDMFCYKHTWDQYALSVLFLDILLEQHDTLDMKNQFIMSFIQLLECNIHMVPSKRMSLHDTLDFFYKLTYETHINVFKELNKCLSV